MNSRQAVYLRPGTPIRRKDGAEDGRIFVVERVERIEHPVDRAKNAVIVHASGQTFRPWEIERVDPQPGWPGDRRRL